MATSDQKKQSDLGEQAIALAEQLGRIAGTVEGTAEAWLKREALADQLAKVRDGAAWMLESLGRTDTSKKKARKNNAGRTTAASSASPRRADPSRAPGKRRRKPAPTLRGVKKSDERIPKQRTATAVRQRRKS